MAILIVFLLGLVVGSFLNCLIYRLETNQSFVFGRSRCPNCQHPLSGRDLIPVLSFIFLGGKCRYCQKKISWQYPLVEISTALIFLLIFNYQFLIFNQFPIFNFIYLLFVSSCLIVIFVFDLKHYLIPDEVLYPAIIVTVLYRVSDCLKIGVWDLLGHWSLVIGNLKTLFNPLVSAFVAGLLFLAIYLITRGRGMGFGDVKLAFLMGLFLGFPKIVVAVFFAFLAGALIGLTLILLRKKTLKSQLPFAPFLVLGTFFALFFGQQIINYYLNLVFF